MGRIMTMISAIARRQMLMRRLRCPLYTYERVLKERRILDQVHKLRIEETYRDEIVVATEYAKNCSFPPK